MSDIGSSVPIASSSRRSPVVDEIRVQRLMRSATDALALLDAERSASAERRQDPVWLPGVKYLLIAAIESCIDIAQHICSAERWSTPSDNGAAMRLLGERGVLTTPTAEALRRAVGFRNVLVHEYVEVDDQIVVARLADLSDIHAFVSEIARWLTGR